MVPMMVLIACVFLTIWQGIIFVGNALNNSLNVFLPANILIFAIGITGVVLHCMGLY